MYSVLIVDNSQQDRREIVNLISSFDDLPLYVIANCENGFEAIEIVRNQKPDILICDMDMPGMNGIELAGSVRSENADIHIIFCSRNDRSHYLQAAIRLNCDGYLMKPLVPADLETCLRQVLLRLLNVKAQRETFDSLRQAMHDNRMSLIKELFSDVLMSHDFSDEFIQHRRRQLEIRDDMLFRLGMVEVNPNNVVSAQFGGDNSMLCFKTYQSLKHDAGWPIPYYVIRISEKRYAIVFCYSSFEHTQEDTGRLTEMALSDFVLKMRNDGVSISATFGSQFSLLSDMRRQYEICCHRLNRRWQYRADPVIFSEDDECCAREGILDAQMIQNDLRQMLECDSDKIKETAADYVKSLLETQTFFQQQMICHYLLGIVHCAIQENNFPPDAEKRDLESLLQRVGVLSSSVECVSFATDLIVQGYTLIHRGDRDVSNDLIDRIKRFIRESDLKSIHLRLIAENFSYSPNYLNHVFKLTTGQTILDYITTCRIARAKEMIQTTNLRLSEIAEEIGYSHATYLSIVFKKQEGVTPKQFMERCRL